MNRVVLHQGGHAYTATGAPADISIPLHFDGLQPSFFGADTASARPMHSGDFIGDTRLGGSCNADHVDFIPHCNGTHTECVGHLTTARVAVNTLATAPLYLAAVISIEPVVETEEQTTLHAHHADRVITRTALEKSLRALTDAEPDALVVRTLPNDTDKRGRKWSADTSPYFTVDAMRWLVQRGIQHLLVDTPSVDRLDDNHLVAHRAYWGLPLGSRSIDDANRPQATITELVFVPDAVFDNLYLLDLQLAPFVSDATPAAPCSTLLAMTEYHEHIAWAQQQDRNDLLAGFRDQFRFPLDSSGMKTLYLAGNSLGLQPVRAARYVAEELEDWAAHGVEGHFNSRRPWMPYHELLAGLTARLVGAAESEVVCMNTLTVNLHFLMVSFFQPEGKRTKILIEQPAFPSDRYAVVSQLKFHGLDPAQHLIEVAPREGEHCLREDDIATTIEKHGHEIALILLPGVQYYSGQVIDMPAITALGQARGCKVGFDLAHAAGNVPLALHDWNVDFAAWCSYKYVNSGPGAIAGAFVHTRYANDDSLPRFAGWWGHDKRSRFRMGPDFQPIPGAEGWQISNPPILSMAPVLASLEIFEQAGMEALRDKSIRLTGYLAWLIEHRLSEHIRIITPANARGCQLSIQLRQPGHGKSVQRQLVERGVICDWREPDVIRVAPVPLYNRYADVYHFVDILRELLRQ